MKSLTFAAPVTFLMLASQAFALCQEGKIFKCTINGKPGTRECFGSGFGPCDPIGDSGPPTETGTVHLKYKILTVVYAPPGTRGGSSGSSVSYGSGSTTGTTTTNSHSFKQDFSVTASASFSPVEALGGGGASGGVSYEYTHNGTQADAIDLKKSTTTTISASGPAIDGIDHDRDQIWLWLGPVATVSITGKLVQWTFGNSGTTDVQYVYAGHLKDPSKIPPGVLAALQRAGITPQDYAEILKADPLAQCLPPVLQPAALAFRPLPGGPGQICRTPAPAAPRFVSLYTTFPYEPPFAQGDPVPTVKYEVDTSSTPTSTQTTESSNKLGITAEGSFGFTKVFKVSLKTDDSWTWTDSSSTANSSGTMQAATVTVGGPAFGYAGPTDMAVYYDTIYKTFAFAPAAFPAGALAGVVRNRDGKPAAGAEVMAVAGGVKYRTFTNSKGEYHFATRFSGPVELQTGNIRQSLPRVEPNRSVDFKM